MNGFLFSPALWSRVAPAGKDGAVEAFGKVVPHLGEGLAALKVVARVAEARSVWDFQQATNHVAATAREVRRTGIEAPIRDRLSSFSDPQEKLRFADGYSAVLDGKNDGETLSAVRDDPVMAEGARSALDVVNANGPRGLDADEGRGVLADVAADLNNESAQAEAPEAGYEQAMEDLKAEADTVPDPMDADSAESQRMDALLAEQEAQPEAQPEPAVVDQAPAQTPGPDPVAGDGPQAEGPRADTEPAPGPEPVPADVPQTDAAPAPGPEPEPAGPEAAQTTPGPEPEADREAATPEPAPEPPAPEPPAPEPAPEPQQPEPEAGY